MQMHRSLRAVQIQSTRPAQTSQRSTATARNQRIEFSAPGGIEIFTPHRWQAGTGVRMYIGGRLHACILPDRPFGYFFM
jgi:uncharacterized protein YqjF (DUF2071 family)